MIRLSGRQSLLMTNLISSKWLSVNKIVNFKSVFIVPGVNLVRRQSTWSFRSDYEEKPVEDPQRFRNSYSNFYHKDLHIAKTTSVYYVVFLFGAFALAILGKPLEWVSSLEKYFGSKGHMDKEIRLEEMLEEEGPSVRRYFTKANNSTGVMMEDSADEDEQKEAPAGKKKSRIGFRDSRIIAYEDRIRSYSTPDKIFRYFATIQDVSGEIYMTPEDFVRSITPGVKQPEGLGLDSFTRVDVKKELPHNDVAEDSVFYLFGENALINFSDYVFLLTVICTPQRQFEIAFRMFDLNGDGELDIEEFDVVRSIIKSGSPMGKRHRDNNVTGNTLSGDMNSSLSQYFFGPNGKKKLTIDGFIKFQHALQKEIMSLEFNRYNPVNGKISEVDFADALLMYAGFSEHKKRKFLRRVRQRFSGDVSEGVSLEDYFAFSHFLRCISDVDTALTFYHLAGAAIDQQTLRHVCQAVASVDLSDRVIALVFALFDENGDGQLSNREFVSVMKQRLLRGLDRPMDTGLVRFLSALSACARASLLGDR